MAMVNPQYLDQTNSVPLGSVGQPTDWFAANTPAIPASGNSGVTGGQPTGNGSGVNPDLARFEKDYWAPDREQVLAQMRGQQAGTDQSDWIAKALADVQSTDDPSYWRNVIAQHGDTNNPQAQAYWIDRIRRGDGSMLVKTGQLQPVNDSGGGGMGFGSLAQRFGQDFKAPTLADLNDPNNPQYAGYQFAKNEGVNALDTSAAAKGTVLNGGQKKDIMNFATGLANQYGQQSYQNALGEYMNRYNIFRNDNNDIFGRFNALAGAGTQAAGAATS